MSPTASQLTPSGPGPAPAAVIGDLISGRLAVDARRPIGEVARLFEAHPDADTIAITGGARVAMVVRSRFFIQLGRRFGFALFENRPVRLLAEEGSTVAPGDDPETVIALALAREPHRIYDDLLVVECGRFLGVVSMRALFTHHRDLLVQSMAQQAILDERARRLEELTHIQADFVANMTHELRSPLNAMLGIAGMILGDENLDENHRRHLFLLVSRGQDLLTIVGNLLDLAKLDAGTLAPFVEEFSPVALFEEMLMSAEPLLAGRPIRLHLRLQGLPATFRTDPVFLRRIVANLLSNAIKFTDVGTVTLAAQSEPGWLVVRISDTGIGIAVEDLPRLFKRFTQLESTRTKRHSGTGLGLAIVKGLVDQLGGQIFVESRSGEGTTLSVRLPEASRAAPVAPLPKSPLRDPGQ